MTYCEFCIEFISFLLLSRKNQKGDEKKKKTEKEKEKERKKENGRNRLYCDMITDY